MSATLPTHGLELRSRLGSDGGVEITVESHPVVPPGPTEVVVQIEAAPLNPSDIGFMLAGADVHGAQRIDADDVTRLISRAPPGALRAMNGRLDRAMPVGNEGAGRVVAAGEDPAAQALLGRTIAAMPGGMYAQYRTLKAADCLVLPPDVAAEDAAACHVNPLTALGMITTLQREGHTALVHTAAASNLGQMLVKLCRADGIALVNVVRSPEQAALLCGLGATHVCDSSAPSFLADLTAAIAQTGATLAFDAVGGGRMAGQILSCMERAILARTPVSDLYGSPVHKQVYLYGGLEIGPTELNRTFGLAWGVGGWLLFSFLQRIGPQEVARLRTRVAREARTTFASHYTRTVSLRDLLDPTIAAAYTRRATGEKFLVNPGVDG